MKYLYGQSLKISRDLWISSVLRIVVETISTTISSISLPGLKGDSTTAWIEAWKLRVFANISRALLSIQPEIRGEVRRSRNSGCVAVCLTMETGCESQAEADNLYEPYSTEKTETNLLSLGKWFFDKWFVNVWRSRRITLYSYLKASPVKTTLTSSSFSFLLFCREVSKILACAYFWRKHFYTGRRRWWSIDITR